MDGGRVVNIISTTVECVAMMKSIREPKPMRWASIFGLLWLVVILLAGCNMQRGQDIADIPTVAAFDSLATAQYLTQNAPPPAYRGNIAFPEVDANLSRMTGGRYVVQLEFNGVFARTPRQTSAHASAEVWFNQVGSSRRVSVQITGEMLGREDKTFEAVRLGPDAFLVQDNQCIREGQDAQTASRLRAGTLVGGINQASPTGLRATINGLDSWQYSFTTADLNLPSIRLSNEGQIAVTSGELWIAPEQEAVTRFYVNLDLTSAIIFERQLPVSGQVILRYDLFDAGKTSNITVPFGC